MIFKDGAKVFQLAGKRVHRVGQARKIENHGDKQAQQYNSK